MAEPTGAVAVSTWSWPAAGYAVGAPMVSGNGGMEFSARGEPNGASEACQLAARELSEPSELYSNDGPAPSGLTGHGAASSYRTASMTAAVASTRVTCSPPLLRLVPVNEKSAAKPYLDWKSAGSLVPRRKPPAGIVVPAGSARSGVAIVIPAVNFQPLTSTSVAP